MSDARKCDRCGKYSDVGSAGKIALKSNVESSRWDEYMDLCEECFAKAKRWLTDEVDK